MADCRSIRIPHRCRALFRRFPRTRIAPPTRLLWGKRDPFLASAMAPQSVALCDRGELAMLEDATHWLHWDAPDRVNALIAGGLAGGAPARSRG